MEDSKDIFNKISKHFFWDIDLLKIDEQKNKTIIIERVFTRGDIDDIKIIFKLYGMKVIKKEIVKAGFLDKKTLNWAFHF